MTTSRYMIGFNELRRRQRACRASLLIRAVGLIITALALGWIIAVLAT